MGRALWETSDIWGGGDSAQASITTSTVLPRDLLEKVSRTLARTLPTWPRFEPWPSHLLPKHVTLEVSIALGHFILREMWVFHFSFRELNRR